MQFIYVPLLANLMKALVCVFFSDDGWEVWFYCYEGLYYKYKRERRRAINDDVVMTSGPFWGRSCLLVVFLVLFNSGLATCSEWQLIAGFGFFSFLTAQQKLATWLLPDFWDRILNPWHILSLLRALLWSVRYIYLYPLPSRFTLLLPL